MSFFEKTNNQHKYYVYIILPKYDNVNIDSSVNSVELKSIERTSHVEIKIIISKIIIPHNYSYIYENYKTIVKKYKEDIHDSSILTYFFDFPLPVYPYNLFLFNRLTLHSYIKVCESLKKINHKINFLCSSNYLKRTKEWGSVWKKNKYIIDKTSETMYTNTYNRIFSSIQDGITKKDSGKTLTNEISKKNEKKHFEKIFSVDKEDNENLFSIYKLSKYYFNINKENEYYKCQIFDQEENYLNCINKRPNYDYIDECIEYFNNENYKIII